ncbi:RidA family protein [Paenibacillus sp. 5J-6]|jgi:enamine deaminase RidA (YjgF/YER057c/UK114 family)|uniref:RidA family protein n=1 Tax=Paenibacillus silvestris TaxID=2606219 RepID=A0A6L8V7C8_9BACL|nr:RidA family protein [Paenibacillus silvestris]MZQ85521.1 RidA family protein [Paenibacillus silvestris]
MSIITGRLKELGVELPIPAAPVAMYVPAVTVNNLVYTSGNDCRINGKLIFEGKLGKDLTIEQGQQAARQTMINLLGVLQAHLGDLDRVDKIVKLLAFVNSADGFMDQPYVINGASELLESVFGENGKHARSAIGTSDLPFNTPVEIEMIVQIKA